MKTIEVSDEMYEQLMKLSNEINNQDHRCTKMPYMFQVQETERIYGIDEDYASDFKWLDEDFNSLKNDFESIKEDLEMRDIEVPENFKEIFEDSWDLDEFMEKHKYRKGFYKDQYKYSNGFFTAEGCKKHIELNSYHYSEPRDYLSFVSRNPEMELIFKFLCGLTGKDLHL